MISELTQTQFSSIKQQFVKKVYLQTWGCQMNAADSERMMNLLATCQYMKTDTPKDADLIILNTCHIREKARHKVVSRLGELRLLKKENPNLVIAVAGCVAQAESESLAKEAPFIDLIFGPDQIELLPKLLEKVLTQPVSSTNFEHASHVVTPFVLTKFDAQDVPYSIPVDPNFKPDENEKQEVTRFVNIIKGCNNFCTFCVVPYTRGREKSRTQFEILEEIRFLTQNGAKEIVLLGQNVNSYGLDLIGATDIHTSNGVMPFTDLLYSVSAENAIQRIRFMTSNPHDFTPSLAKAFADLPKITNAFHLPVQSGSNKILNKMNRQYTREEYLERVGWIRNVRPNIAFSTDIIVGFPDETDEDFEHTVSLVKEMQYAFIYAFKYSERKGTPAIRFKNKIPEDIKDKRLKILLDLQQKETLKQNLDEIGKIKDVMIIYKNMKEDNSWYGRTYEGRLTKIHTPHNLIGETLPIKIKNANLTALEGCLTA